MGEAPKKSGTSRRDGFTKSNGKKWRNMPDRLLEMWRIHRIHPHDGASKSFSRLFGRVFNAYSEVHCRLPSDAE
jgi:hypothetical protein